MAKHVEIITTHYEFATGNKPRGEGSWAFAPTPNAKPDDVIWAHCMSYGMAKSVARSIAMSKNISVLYVLS